MTPGFLGLGANVGDRRGHLEVGVRALPRHGIVVRASSSVYETQAVGPVADQGAFLNAVVRIETELDPEALLLAIKEVEREVGRRSGGVPKGPRELDVDALVLAERAERRPRLVLPHPELTHRRFVLVPFLELEPDFVLPDGIVLREAAAALEGTSGQNVVRHSGPLP